MNWQKSLWSNWRLEKRKRNNKYGIVPTLGKCFYRELKYVWIKKINKNILKLDNKIDHKIFCKKRKRNERMFKSKKSSYIFISLSKLS